jgi:pimeloyl-ACP methyl ester carboxylesterase
MSVGSIVTLATERIVEPVEGMHRAIAAPWFAALGAAGRPVRVTHDVISRVVYESIRLGAAIVGAGVDTRVAPDSSSADRAQAFVNGLWGDTLGRHEPRVGTSMSVRDRQGVPIPLGSEFPAAFPTATDRLVVLVHGLVKTERCWHGTDTKPGLMRALEDDPALTPVAVRYNTGHSVGTNGARLASLLEAVHARWPQPVRSVALVGHSMGGLVIRSACAAAGQAGHSWIGDVSDVVTIGSPHRGAPLEKLVNAAAWALRVTPQTRALADFLDARSQGIKDLRHGRIGYALDEEPEGNARLPHVEHHFIAGVITSNPAHPVGAVVGDLMVRPASSTRAPRLEPANVAILGGVSHFDLLHEPAVIDQVMAWLAPSR